MAAESDREQLNTAAPASADAPTEEYSLEDILREFGSSPPPEEAAEAAPPKAEPAVVSETPPAGEPTAPTVEEVPAPAAEEPPPAKTQPLSRSTIRFRPPCRGEAQAAKSAGTQAIPVLPPGIKSGKPPKPPKSAPAQKPHITALAKKAPPTPQELLTKPHSGIGLFRLRLFLLLPLALLTLLPSVSEYLPISLDFLPAELMSWSSVGLFTLAMLLALEVNVRGVSDLLHLRVGLYTPAVAAAVLALIHTVHHRSSIGPNYCAVVIVLYFFLLRSILCEKKAMRYTLRAVSSFSSPMGVYDTPQLIRDTASLRRDIGKTDDFMEHLLQPDRPQKLFRLYGWCILLLTGAGAWLMSYFMGKDLVLSWLVLLLGALPLCGAMSYSRPFAHLAKRLSQLGGALCGWYGAKIFGGKHTIILRDEDLFPKSSISSNGMKLYGAYPASRVIAYALAALNAANSPLVDLFETLLQSQLGSHYPVADHRFYDIGGIGAEIFDDIVLVGSLAFMRSMGVHMPEGARVRQAVYVSINGELAGVFALRYKANHSTKTGLRSVLANRNFSVVLATRDFLITPELISAKYELSAAPLRFPDYRERLRLSANDRNDKNRQGALIAKDSFGAFATAVAAGRKLRISALFSAFLSVFSGIVGLALCAALLLLDAQAVISPLNMLLFQLIWAAVNGLLTYVLLRF